MKSKLRNNGTNWLIQIALVISLFTFSGFRTPHTQQQPSTKIELLIDSRSSSKRGIFFNHGWINCYPPSKHNKFSFNEAILRHAQNVKTKLNVNNQSVLDFNRIQVFLGSMDITFISEEDSFHPLRG